ncbi:phospholipase A and acyltransferase 2-like [Argopecten irradians]|uniref:phospholipase A and acyltransferase 2-like n=1 Tax=Argopecten irradians TaxID=31199 RepID=UPI003713ECF2
MSRYKKWKVGDLIEIRRNIGLYSHWGVYLGNGEIVHVTPLGYASRKQSRVKDRCCDVNFKVKACVKIEDIFKVDKRGNAKRNNRLDHYLRALSNTEIVQRALKMIGPIDYSLFSNNCEHFAVYLRYGVKWSVQIENIFGCTFGLGAIAVGRFMLYIGDTPLAFIGLVLVAAVVIRFLRNSLATVESK